MPQDVAALMAILATGRRLWVVVHDNPDPDALASACALTRLAEAKTGLRCRVCGEGMVGRAENRTLARELHLRLVPLSEMRWDKRPLVALVDAQPGAGNTSLPKNVVPDIVIDHHPLRLRTRARFLDVRPEYGACSTILAEYLDAAGVAVAPDLAAGLCYAIATDTQDLAREALPADTQAYLRLYQFADQRMLGRVRHPRLLHSYYSELARALLSAFTYTNIIGSHLGPVAHRDSVSLAADLLLRHERMSWSIATGVWNDCLYVSLRAVPGRHHAGDMLSRALGRRGRAGGHGTMAGGRISVAGLAPEQRDQLQKETVLRLIHVLKRREEAVLRPLIGTTEAGG